jgi:hypothetical protein
VFIDRFKSFCKPQGNLPSGSFVLVGSMSHLARNGFFFGLAESPIQDLTPTMWCISHPTPPGGLPDCYWPTSLLGGLQVSRLTIPAPPPASSLPHASPLPAVPKPFRRRSGFLTSCRWRSSGARGWGTAPGYADQPRHEQHQGWQ